MCGVPARVRVLEGYAHGRPLVRRYCMTCAEAVEHPSSLSSDGMKGRRRLGVGSLLMVTGIIAGSIASLADHLAGGGYGGFGVYQTVAVVLGALFVLLGTLTRVDVLAVFGMLVFAVAVVADLARVGGSPGFGLKQQIGVAIALLLVGVGFALRRRARHGGARAVVDGRTSAA